MIDLVKHHGHLSRKFYSLVLAGISLAVTTQACMFTGPVATSPLLTAPDCPPGTSPPSGGLIAFMSYQDHHYEIYTMNSNGSGRTQLTNSPISAYDPSWSADGKKIFFLSKDSTQGSPNYDLFVMNADGSEQTLLTKNVQRGVKVSSDGLKILFMRRVESDANSSYSEIYNMNVDGSGLTKLTMGAWIDNFAWSPDGEHIVFEEDIKIYVMNADGSGKKKLPAGRYGNTFPTWSPDGSRIAFSKVNVPLVSESYYHLFTIRPDGTGLTDLYDDASGSSPLEWSPDGKRIAFFSLNRNLNVIDADGSNAMRFAEPADGESPKWSPDGQWLAFKTFGLEGDGNYDFDIAITKSTCSGLWNLTNTPGDDGYPVWQPK